MKKQAHIINIGDELLIGQVVNTNASWLANELGNLGISVSKIIVIADEETAILQALSSSLKQTDIIFTTGGLGPTKDDITKAALCKMFDVELKYFAEVATVLEKKFATKGKFLSESNRHQAWLPANCTPITNNWGTACGMQFDHNNKVMYSLPGVPKEMQNICTTSIFPDLKKQYRLTPASHITLLTEGIPESILMEKLNDIEDSLPKHIQLAYLPGAGQVRLRLTSWQGFASTHKEITEKADEIKTILNGEVYGLGKVTLAAVLKNLLLKKKQTIATAESCTGGFIAQQLTTIPGVSAVYKGSVVAYENSIKMQELGVKKKDLEKYGTVSKAVVEQMAKHVREKYKTHYAISTSGIAGPDGGTKAKPLGTVWVAWATPQECFSKQFRFASGREGNIYRTSMAAINILRKKILKLPISKHYWEVE